MRALMYILLLALAGVMLAGKFGAARRAGETQEAYAIRHAVWRTLQVVGLLLLVVALCGATFVLFTGYDWRGR